VKRDDVVHLDELASSFAVGGIEVELADLAVD